MTINELAKKIAEDFNESIRSNGFEDFKEMRRSYDWDAKDIRDEIQWTANDIINGEYDYHVRKFGTHLGFDGVVILDDCSVCHGREELTYGQFKKMIFANVM